MELPAHRPNSHEVSAAASAALAKATIEAKFTIALHRPRSYMQARETILEACKRERFAEGALYRKPIKSKGKDSFIEGLSIRFAEHALNSWRNVDVSAVTAWENEDQRLVRITVTDLESNLSYADEILLNKTVERSKVYEGQIVVGTRQNTVGEKVFIVRATEDDLQNKLNAAKSKAIRNSGLRLIPQDILEEAEESIRETQAKGGKDTKGAAKKVADGFSDIGVPPAELEAYLGHSLDIVSPSELTQLRAIYSAIRDGESNWIDYRKQSAEEANPQPKVKRAKEAKTEPPDEIPGAESPKAAAKTKLDFMQIVQALEEANIPEDIAMGIARKEWPTAPKKGNSFAEWAAMSDGEGVVRSILHDVDGFIVTCNRGTV